MKPVSTKPTPDNIARVTTLLAETPPKLAQLSAGLTQAQLHHPLGPGERSFTEDLAHLLNSEARFPEAVYLALLANEPLFENLHPERELGPLLRYTQFPFADLLAYFKLRRTFILSVLNALSAAQWSRTIQEEGKKRRESVYWRARALALHEHEHLEDLARKLNRTGTAE